MFNRVELAKAVPPVLDAYHFIAVPVAVKLDTVAPEQKFWVVVPVGAGVSFTILTEKPLNFPNPAAPKASCS